MFNFRGGRDMNYMKEVAKLLGYEVGEEFNIILDNGDYSKFNPYRFTDNDLVDKLGNNITSYIAYLVTGEYKIEKIPFVPKVGSIYWTYGTGIKQPYIEQFPWGNTCYDKERKLLGIVFRTEQEAKDYLPTWQKRLEGEEI